MRYFMDLLMEKQRPVMLVGNAGTGKSVLMRDKLEALSADEYLVQFVPFNFYTTSAMLQGKAGSRHRAGLCRTAPWPGPATHPRPSPQPSSRSPWRRNRGETTARPGPRGLSTSSTT